MEEVYVYTGYPAQRDRASTTVNLNIHSHSQWREAEEDSSSSSHIQPDSTSLYSYSTIYSCPCTHSCSCSCFDGYSDSELESELSRNATTDDLPGPGRTFGKYCLFPLRRVLDRQFERVVCRVRILMLEMCRKRRCAGRKGENGKIRV
ncbi:uncharacterized protein FOMMEDRAFT_23720 [Fomitiporia mediterranea MF3/22]|uniref:uncharacterized protein n=1 Tax=Fomitiporia mediterranea (strain MF3/22) TaxID=694068 RepID=UPI0004407F1F|nr:uncharacterized protein FOMMEDRAFT_23720 [Fomitiporia mediterranea MF3/22]EJC98484.1 hypothetical protein FOMMEDRAFT_23720 [Fomitiporia mediterranea MF3/22]